MRKIFILVIAFCMLVAYNAFASAYVSTYADNFAPKNEISNVRKSRKINSIQKFILKKTFKKLQKQALNPQKSQKKKSYIIMGVLVILGVIFGLLFRGIQLIIAGNISTGIILISIGLICAGLFVLWQVLDATGYKYR